jgi:hypothetical protein
MRKTTRPVDCALVSAPSVADVADRLQKLAALAARIDLNHMRGEAYVAAVLELTAIQDEMERLRASVEGDGA